MCAVCHLLAPLLRTRTYMTDLRSSSLFPRLLPAYIKCMGVAEILPSSLGEARVSHPSSPLCRLCHVALTDRWSYWLQGLGLHNTHFGLGCHVDTLLRNTRMRFPWLCSVDGFVWRDFLSVIKTNVSKKRRWHVINTLRLLSHHLGSELDVERVQTCSHKWDRLGY